jgi:hypothetical protein
MYAAGLTGYSTNWAGKITALGCRQSILCATTTIWSSASICLASSLRKVRIEVEDGILTVSGEHEERRSEEDDDGRYLRRERRLGAFSRSIALPSVWMRKRSRR